ncbi:hypothetical protein M446_1763 [Methylobacterium sp. 4-46]|uniref:hypothetical protein n=1 Tax=unclassified Methylobacterium TaxID=2615210 RepID=UPI000152D863|nr:MULTISPECIES: hypothetical protein [Methylobacterium]ACA16253.1 hypothetical protein M446_1763 [Methylobacterium sp. 4-46]WFT81960.1 hypothetical protein QA634_08910 [Methylobacterium nodulans]
MSLILKPAPEHGRAIVARAVRDLWSADAGAGAAGGAALNLSEPIPLYRLGLDQVSAEGVSGAEPVGWRYLLEAGSGSAAVADLGQRAGDEARFASLSRGDSARRLMDAAALAATIADGKPTPYEIRILDVPALHVSAIWLSGKPDIFIPYLDIKRLRGGDVEVDDDFVRRLDARAKSMRDALTGMAPRPAAESGG